MRDQRTPSEPPPHAGRARPEDALMGRTLALVRYLRERCPWDARQDPRSLRPYLLEEAHEVAEAIAAEDDRELLRELGDLLLNVAFQVVLAEERGAFAAREVVEGLEEKMRARHPHIYGDATEPPDWEELKAREREVRRRHEAAGGEAGVVAPEVETERPDPFEGVPAGLEPLSRALRVQERMAALGFDWPDAAGPLEKIREETEELERAVATGEARAADVSPEGPEEVEEEVGDLLFSAVNLARHLGVHPSNALLGAISKFQWRCREIWRLAAERQVDLESASLEELDALWEVSKGAGGPPGG